MKLTIFVLVAALCLAGVSANAIGFEDSLPTDLEYVPVTLAEDVVDIENFTIFSSFYWIAKAALRTLKGANCTIKQVLAIKTAAQDFVDNIQSCGSDAAAAFKNVISAAQSVISTCNKIINLNEQVCNNQESTNGKTSTPFKCFVKLMGQMTTLYKQVQNTLSAIKKVPSVPSDAAACTTAAVNELTSVFTSFPANVKTCSKLTSSKATQLEYVPETFAEDVVNIENFTIFSSFYWIAKAALRTLKGANCTIKQVLAIKTAAQDFVDNIQSCGSDAAAAFKNVISAAQSVISTCNKIINLNEQVCNNQESTNGKTSTPFKCFVKLMGQMTTLYKQVQNTLSAIKKVPSVPSDAATCTTNAVNELTSVFTSFPANVKTCSKLTSSKATQLEYVPETFAEDVVDIENYTIFSSFYWIAKAALRTLKGANCTIKQVLAIKTAAQDFVDNIQSCGSDAAAAFKNVISAAQSVISTCNKIINLNEQVCNNQESTNGKTSTPFKCFVKLMGQMTTLYKQVQNTLSAIKKVPSVPSDAATCTTNAVNELISVFTSFPANVKTCSKLTSSKTTQLETENVDIENFSFFGTFYAIVKATLKTLQGVNCTIKEVLAVKAAAQDFIDNIESCGAEATAAFMDVITSVESVITTCDNIININDRYCNSDENSSGKTPLMCSVKLLSEIMTLYQQIEDTLNAIKNVPSVPAEAAACTNSAVDDLTSAFNSFPTNVEACAN